MSGVEVVLGTVVSALAPAQHALHSCHLSYAVHLSDESTRTEQDPANRSSSRPVLQPSFRPTAMAASSSKRFSLSAHKSVQHLLPACWKSP
jgi:hypothetical protein